MKFSTRQDIEAPIDFVFRHAADFEAHARQAMRRGIEVARADNLDEPAPGMCWNLRFSYRGKARRMFGELVEFEAPTGFAIQSESGGIESRFEAEFLTLSQGRTRLRAGLQISPRTLSARLLVQSMKLAKGRLSDAFAARVAQFAEDLEDRYVEHRGGGIGLLR